MVNFELVNQPKKKFACILWDIDGPIYFQGSTNNRVLKAIVNLARQGIFQRAITGRDINWIKKHIIPALKKIVAPEEFDSLSKVLSFSGELGSIKLSLDGRVSEVSKLVTDHVITDMHVRKELASLMWQPSQLLSHQSDKPVPENMTIIGDANGKFYLAPKEPPEDLMLKQFIASDTKEVIFTAEVIRNEHQEVPIIDTAGAVQVIKPKLQELGIENRVEIHPTRTAIDIVPVVKGLSLAKNWAAGLALYDFYLQLVSSGSNITIEELAQRTLAVGDGMQDFLMCFPALVVGESMIGFVGPENQYDKDSSERVFIKPLSDAEIGSEVAAEMIAYVEEHLIEPILAKENSLS